VRNGECEIRGRDLFKLYTWQINNKQTNKVGSKFSQPSHAPTRSLPSRSTGNLGWIYNDVVAARQWPRGQPTHKFQASNFPLHSCRAMASCERGVKRGTRPGREQRRGEEGTPTLAAAAAASGGMSDPRRRPRGARPLRMHGGRRARRSGMHVLAWRTGPTATSGEDTIMRARSIAIDYGLVVG
jgi:hypothetical protein